MVARLFGKVPFRNQTIWLPGHLLSRLNERDGLSGGARTGGAVSHYLTHATSHTASCHRVPSSPLPVRTSFKMVPNGGDRGGKERRVSYSLSIRPLASASVRLDHQAFYKIHYGITVAKTT